MRICAVDDDRGLLDNLVGMCRDYAKSRSMDLTADAFTQGPALLEAWEPQAYSLVFVDVYMEAMGSRTSNVWISPWAMTQTVLLWPLK